MKKITSTVMLASLLAVSANTSAATLDDVIGKPAGFSEPYNANVPHLGRTFASTG